jgi:hypothetical protein
MRLLSKYGTHKVYAFELKQHMRRQISKGLDGVLQYVVHKDSHQQVLHYYIGAISLMVTGN